MDNNIYLQLKGNIRREIGQAIYLKDIAELSCPPEVKDKISKLVVLSGHKVGMTVISAIEVIEMVKSVMPSALVFSMGEAKICIHVYREKESTKIAFTSFIKVALTSLVLFVGSGLAIMYFHADVNMHEVHEAISFAVTGQKDTSLYWISIPYSIGIGLGISLFFGIFPNKNKSKAPDPLKIGIYKYKKDINSYLESQEGRKRED